MKIALLTDGITPYVMGGIQRHSFYLCKYLARNDIEVHLYYTAPEQPKDLDVFSEDEKKNIRFFFIPFPKHAKLPGHYVREFYEYSEAVFDSFMQQSADVDFIYAKNYTAWKFLEEKRKGSPLPSVGVNLHGYELYQLQTNIRDWFGRFSHKRPTDFISRNADLVFSYGGKITDILTEKIGIKRSKIREVPTGIDADWIIKEEKATRKGGQTNFVFVGRYTKRKGIDAIEKIMERYNTLDCTFTFIGPIPEDKRIYNQNTRYTGPLNDASEIKGELQKADVLLCPSTAEGMPNVILEAMASGCAIIATNIGAIPEMVGEDNGWLIEPNNTETLISAFKNALKTPNLQEKQINSIQKVQRNFLWSRVITNTLSAIKTMH